MPSPDVQHPAEIATPHDLLLTGSAIGIASGMMPDTSWGRFGLNLARRPGVVAERVGSFGRELASIATGTSRSRSGQARQAFQRSSMADQSVDEAINAGVLGRRRIRGQPVRRRGTRLARRRTNPIRARRRHGRARTEQQPVDQPVGLEGDHRHRWSERRSRGATLPERYGGAAADSVDGGARRIHGRRGYCCHAGRGRLPQRGVRTHPVHTTNREGVDGAAADGAAGDQQVLHLGHRPVVGAWWSTSCARVIRFSPSRGAIRLRHNGPGAATRTVVRSSTHWTRSDQ